MTDAVRPDVTEMNAIHGVFRRMFAVAPGLVHRVQEGDTERAELVGGYVADVAEVLDLHHAGEDELLVPLLRERSGQAELVDRVAGQHRDIHGPLGRVRDLAARFRASGRRADGDALVEALAELEAAALPHLDEEEARLMPLAAEHVTVEEWDRLPGHTMSRFTGDFFFILGQVRDHMTEEQRARMLAGMPPPVVDGWTGGGADAYRARLAALDGS